MPQQRTLRGALDDSMMALSITDFSGGLNSETDPSDLKPNETPDCQNVKFLKPGRVIGRNGYVDRVESIPATPDGIAFFYDNNGTRRLILWADGNIYDCSAFALTVVASAVYTAGERIAWCVLNDVIYYSDGAISIRYYDPTTSTEAALVSSGDPTTIDIPAAKALAVYAGSIVAGATTVSGTFEPHSIRWCTTNDPTTWLGAAVHKIGEGQGGEINSVLTMSVSSSGVSPYRALFVGKSRFGVFGMKGALGDLEEVIINAPTGVIDGHTVKYVPGPDGSGYVVFLGTDNKVWYTNGIHSGELSGAIRTELANYIYERTSTSTNPTFAAVVNYSDFQYVLDLGGGRQYCYDYDRKTWTRYSGWPSGYWTEAKNASGEHILYCADRDNDTIAQCNIGPTDNGEAIAPYIYTPYLHAGDAEILKIWKHVFVAFATDDGNISGTVTVNMGEGDSVTFTLTPDTTTDDAKWDESNWDEANWASSVLSNLPKWKKRARLRKTTTGLDGSYESLRGYDCQVKLTTSVTGSHFEVFSLTLLFLPRGRKRVAD